MKICRFALSICGLFLVQNSWADDISSQIQQLQTQISQLQTQMNSSAAKTSFVASDSAAPLGELDGNDTAYSLLQAQNQYRAPITLGGYFSAALQTWGGSNLTGLIGRSRYDASSTVFAATSADLYTLANINSWTQAFVTIEGGLNGYQTIISEAFLNFGNLSKSPFYATIGDTDLPFGTFPGNGLVASSLEADAFEPNQIAQMDIGFSQGNLNTVLALFNGQNNLSDFAYSLQYSKTFNRFTLQGGGGYMNDIRYTGSSVAAAYGTSNSIHNIRTGILQGGRNGAVDLNANATYAINDNQSFNAAAEWTTTTNSPTAHGIPTGKMQAWSATGSYTLPIFNMSTTFALDYSATINMHAVPLQLPTGINQQSVSIYGMKNQWLGDFQTEILNNVYLGPEYAWIKMYNGEHTWESALNLSVYL